MTFAVYTATAVALLWLVHRAVRPLSRGAFLFLYLVPFVFAGDALLRGRALGPVDAAYIGPPLSAIRLQRGVGAPHNLVTTDIYTQMIPWRHAVRESLRHGEWPLWNRFILCGDILAAAAQPAVWSPLTWIACLLPPALSFTFTAAICWLLAAIGAFVFARELGCRESTAAIAATGWAYCTSLVLYALWPLGMWALLPFVLLGTRRAIHDGRGALLAVSLIATILSGHPETVLHVVAVGAAYGLFELPRTPRKMRALGVAAIAGIVALLVCAIYLLPILDAAPQTAEYAWRKVLRGVDRSESWTAAGVGFLTNFFPFLHIRAWIDPPNAGMKAETAIAGSIVLALAAYAVTRVRSRETWFFAALAAAALIVHSNCRPVAALLRHVPLFDITLNVRLVFAAAFSFAILAALGAEALLARDDRRAAAVVATITLIALAGGSLWIERSFTIAPIGHWGDYRLFADLFFLGLAALLLLARTRWLAPALVALIALQRGISDGGMHASFPRAAAYPPMQLFEPLGRVPEPFRIVGQGLSLIPATGALYGLEDVRGYEAMTLMHYYRTYPVWCIHQSVFFNRVDDITNSMLSMMNVRFAFTGADLGTPPGWHLVARQGNALLLENEQVLERAFVPQRVRIGFGDEASVNAMHGVPDFREVAFIDANQPPYERANGPGRVTKIARPHSGEYAIEADMQGDGWLVVSDSAWNGWRAYVDGRRVRVQRANVAFLGVHLPQGRHTVRLRYWPQSFVAGRAVTGATLLAIAAFVYSRRSWRARRSVSPSSSSSS
ncbi:MAG TPA: YfhO family protein [Thermoanaerobaculia bacterium]|jgi:hypothetical protein